MPKNLSDEERRTLETVARSLSSLYWNGMNGNPKIIKGFWEYVVSFDGTPNILPERFEGFISELNIEQMGAIYNAYRKYSLIISKCTGRISFQKKKLEDAAEKMSAGATSQAHQFVELSRNLDEVEEALQQEYIASIELFAVIGSVLTEFQEGLLQYVSQPNQISVSCFAASCDL